jgi:hypothetical protein
MGNKKALLVGINYPHTNHELKGCINDVLEMEKVLREHFQFQDIIMLLDAAATTDGILTALENLVKDAKPGDILYFHYSGHGSQMLDDADADHEPDGLDEIICPIDLNWDDKVIRDDDLKRIFDKVPYGVNLTVMLDCCNSGGGMDHLYQYQPEVESQISETKVGKTKGRYLTPPNKIELYEKKIGFKKRILQKNIDRSGLMLSGCQSHQTSADAYINGKYMGAATYACVTALKTYNYTIGYKTLIDEMNHWLADVGFSQRPELNGPLALHDKSYLDGYEMTQDNEIHIEPEEEILNEGDDEMFNETNLVEEEKPNLTGKLILAVVIITLVVIGAINIF